MSCGNGGGNDAAPAATPATAAGVAARAYAAAAARAAEGFEDAADAAAAYARAAGAAAKKYKSAAREAEGIGAVEIDRHHHGRHLQFDLEAAAGTGAGQIDMRKATAAEWAAMRAEDAHRLLASASRNALYGAGRASACGSGSYCGDADDGADGGAAR